MEIIRDRPHQPYLHELVSCVRSPAVVLSASDGQIHAAGAQGLFVNDIRHLSRLEIGIEGQQLVAVGHGHSGAARAEFTSVVLGLGDPIADPTVQLSRERLTHESGFEEVIRLHNRGRGAVAATLTAAVSADHAAVTSVKSGAGAPMVRPVSAEGTILFSRGARSTTVLAQPEPTEMDLSEDVARLAWGVDVDPGTTIEIVLVVDTDTDSEVAALWAAPSKVLSGFGDVTVRSRRRELGLLTRRGLEDVSALLMVDRAHPDDVFVAGGSPWFFTLFGRDSLWAARFLLPVGTDVAVGTLRTLARRQGRRHVTETGEQPGKILHEVRSRDVVSDRTLPAVYFGTIDATALWISLLHDVWRWGGDARIVRELLASLEAALEWLTTHADADGDGFLEYFDATGTGLANQGWKDSGDAVLDASGRIAPAPIVLCEAQAYAVRAALDGAALLEALGRDGARELVDFAGDLTERFRKAFWVERDGDRFPALALDAEKRPVESLTSNVGHLLGTGILSADEAGAVARLLADPRLDSGHGLRTLSSSHPRFNPLGYHTGTVWPHDTAIAIKGLTAEGHEGVARRLADGLLDSAAAFDYRYPELFGGWGAAHGPPVAYPAACRPQGWAGAVPLVLVTAALGLRVDAPAGSVTVNPPRAFADWFPLEVHDLVVAGRTLSVRVDIDGNVDLDTRTDLEVQVP